MARLTLLLGRDGMGDATADDFDRWVGFVRERIGAACGFPVDVIARREKGVQSDGMTGGTEGECDAVQVAKEHLWREWCAKGAP